MVTLTRYSNVADGDQLNFGLFNDNWDTNLVLSGKVQIESLRQMDDAGLIIRGDNLGIFRDYFKDADGINDSVDLLNTSAQYDLATESYGIFEVFIIIEASAAPAIAINNCEILQIGTGKFLVHCTVGDAEVQRAQIYKTLYYGTDGTDSKILDFTTVTLIKTSEAADVGMKFVFAQWQVTGVNGTNRTNTVDATFSDTSTNTQVSSWSFLGNDASPTSTTLTWEMPINTVLHSKSDGITSNSDEFGTDTSGDDTSNPATSRMKAVWGGSNPEYTIRGLVGFIAGDLTWGTPTTDGITASTFVTELFSGIPVLTDGSSEGFVVQTVALFNNGLGSTLQTFDAPASGTTSSSDITCVANEDMFITRLKFRRTGAGASSITVKDASLVDLYNVTSVNATEIDHILSPSDYTRPILSGETFVIRVNTTFHAVASQSTTGTLFDFTTQTTMADNSGTDALIEARNIAGDTIQSIGVVCDKTDNGTNPITYDVSSDNGSTFTTGLSLNRKNDITSTVGKIAILRFQIPVDGSVKLNGYCAKIKN